MKWKALFLLLITQSAVASVTISTIENRKTGDQITIERVTDETVDVILKKGFGSKVIATLSVQRSVEGAYELRTQRGLKLEVHRTIIQASYSVAEALAEANSAVWEHCMTAYEEFYFGGCFFPIPGVAVVYPAMNVGMGSAVATTFILGMVVLPFEAAINGVGLLLPNAQRKADRTWNRAVQGKSKKLSHRAFQKLLASIALFK